VTAFFGKLPGWVRVPLLAVLVGGGVAWIMTSMLKADPRSWEPVLGAALGALAAWRFRWRARATWQRRLLMAAVAVFAAGMIAAHLAGADHGNTWFFLFSVLLVSLPYGRAIGREERSAARHEAEMAREKEREEAQKQDTSEDADGPHDD
jgi:hypothetical protein